MYILTMDFMRSDSDVVRWWPLDLFRPNRLAFEKSRSPRIQEIQGITCDHVVLRNLLRTVLHLFNSGTFSPPEVCFFKVNADSAEEVPVIPPWFLISLATQ